MDSIDTGIFEIHWISLKILWNISQSKNQIFLFPPTTSSIRSLFPHVRQFYLNPVSNCGWALVQILLSCPAPTKYLPGRKISAEMWSPSTYTTAYHKYPPKILLVVISIHPRLHVCTLLIASPFVRLWVVGRPPHNLLLKFFSIFNENLAKLSHYPPLATRTAVFELWQTSICVFVRLNWNF